MDYREFRRQLGKAGVTVNDYSSLLHVRPSSISNYAKKGFVPQAHAIIAVALGEAGDNGTDFLALLARYGVSPERSTADAGRIAILANYRNVANKPRNK
jgi:hypothetical protein